MTEQPDPLVVLIAISIVFGPFAIWAWRSSRNQPKPKLDFGPEKGSGWFYYVWNWKSYAMKIVWIGATPVVWYLDGASAATMWFIFGGILVLMGKFWDLFK